MAKKITEQILTVDGECLSLNLSEEISKAIEQLKEICNTCSKRGYTDITWNTWDASYYTRASIFYGTRKETKEEKKLRVEKAGKSERNMLKLKTAKLERLKLAVAKLAEEIKASQR